MMAQTAISKMSTSAGRLLVRYSISNRDGKKNNYEMVGVMFNINRFCLMGRRFII